MKISEYIQLKINSEKNSAYNDLLNLKSLRYRDEELIIKDCPCCGHEAILVFGSETDPPCHYTVGQIKCTNCRIQTASRCLDGYYGDTSTINDLLNDWNNRAIEK